MTERNETPPSRRRLTGALFRFAAGCLALGALLAVAATPARAADARHYTYYNPNPTFDGDWTGLTESTHGRDRSLTLARQVVWSNDFGGGAKIRSAVRLANGNTLVADSAGRRVIEITRDGQVAWSYDSGDDPTLESPTSAHASDGGGVLIADSKGRQVLEVARDKSVIWRYDAADNAKLDGPTTARTVPGSDNVLVTDTSGGQVIEVTRENEIVWQSKVSDRPRDAHRLPSGQTLITDESDHRVCTVGAGSDVVWQFGETGVAGLDSAHLDSPTSADRLADGSTVIADTGSGRVVRVSSDGELIDVYGAGGASDSDSTISPDGGASATAEGLLIADTGGHRLLEVGYAGAGRYDTGDLNLGIPGVNKWVTDILPDALRPEGSSVKVSYSLNGGAWKSAGKGGDFSIPSPGPAGFARFRVDFTTTDPGLSPRLDRLDVMFYLAEPPVYKPKKKSDKGSGSGEGAATTGTGSGSSGSGSGGGVSLGSGSGTGTGTGTTTVIGSGSGSTVAAPSGGSAPKAVATDVPLTDLGGMLSGWVLDEKTVGQQGDGVSSAGGALTDPAGIAAAALLLMLAYSAGVSSGAFSGALLAVVRPMRSIVMRSMNG